MSAVSCPADRAMSHRLRVQDSKPKAPSEVENRHDPSSIRMETVPATSQLRRLEQKYVVDPESGCWIWGGLKHRWRPAIGEVFRITPQHHPQANYAAWYLLKGPLPAHYRLRRTCATPSCINPDHHQLMVRAKHIETLDDLKTLARIVEPKGCWIATTAKDPSGTALIQRCSARRIAYEIAYGKIPARTVVRNKCGQPACLNPAHLYLQNRTELEGAAATGQPRRDSPSARHKVQHFTSGRLSLPAARILSGKTPTADWA
jgi:hypothetical protein